VLNMFRSAIHTARQFAASRRHQRTLVVVADSLSPRLKMMRCSSSVENIWTTVDSSIPPIQCAISVPSLGQHRFLHTSMPCLESEKAAPESNEAPTEPAAAAPETKEEDGSLKEYSTPELTRDAAEHKAALNDPDRPSWQNPLIHKKGPDSKIFREDFDSEEEFQKAIQPAPPLDLGDGSPATPEYLNALADEIVHLTVLEMNELVNKMADHYGFHEGMLSPDDAAFAAGAELVQEEVKVEKLTFDVKLTGFDAKAKIKIIKEVRAIAGLGLKEAKEFVESAPKIIQKDLKKEQAEEIKAKLEELGATVEIV
jgi:large subunit ribosomal protein L7/L12